jgi:hypothetical protein
MYIYIYVRTYLRIYSSVLFVFFGVCIFIFTHVRTGIQLNTSYSYHFVKLFCISVGQSYILIIWLLSYCYISCSTFH